MTVVLKKYEGLLSQISQTYLQGKQKAVNLHLVDTYRKERTESGENFGVNNILIVRWLCENIQFVRHCRTN